MSSLYELTGEFQALYELAVSEGAEEEQGSRLPMSFLPAVSGRKYCTGAYRGYWPSWRCRLSCNTFRSP